MQFATSPVKPEFWNRLIEHIHYVRGDFQDPNSYAELSRLWIRSRLIMNPGQPLLLFGSGAKILWSHCRPISAAGLAREEDGFWRRVIIEKPFGHDLASAKALNAEIKQYG